SGYAAGEGLFGRSLWDSTRFRHAESKGVPIHRPLFGKEPPTADRSGRPGETGSPMGSTPQRALRKNRTPVCRRSYGRTQRSSCTKDGSPLVNASIGQHLLPRRRSRESGNPEHLLIVVRRFGTGLDSPCAGMTGRFVFHGRQSSSATLNLAAVWVL